jgi:hypothetical protein
MGQSSMHRQIEATYQRVAAKFLIALTIVLVVIGVAPAGRWVGNMWTHLLPA